MLEPRFITHVSTDKPIYKLGDIVYIRSISVNAIDHSPAIQNREIWIGEPKIQIIEPSGNIHETIFLYSENLQNGSLAAQWTIPTNLPGGNYTLRMECNGKGFNGGEREINIREFQNPRLNSQLEFVKKAYSPGEKALATLKVVRAEGGIPEGASVETIARIDGQEIQRGQVKLNSQGKTLIGFKIPKLISKGNGSLVCVIHDNGVKETQSKTIPVIIQKVDVDIYPEGGDLIAGLPCGLYVEARLPSSEPADITANIVNQETHHIVGTVQTVHEGRGKTHFTPEECGNYELRVIKPQGVRVPVPLPEVKKTGISLVSDENIYEPYQPIGFHLASTEPNSIIQVDLYKKDVSLASIRIKTKEAGQSYSGIITAPTSTNADGVLRLLASKKESDGSLVPVAERLIFRTPSEKLNVKLIPDRKKYTPADQVKLSVQVTNEDNNPVPKAIVGLTVTDETVLEMQDDRKKPPLLDAMLLLEAEVKQLKDSRIYLSDNSKASKAIDLLLGTQGWRRFAFGYNREQFRNEYPDQSKRVLAPYEGIERDWSSDEDFSGDDFSDDEFCEMEEEEEDDDDDDGGILQCGVRRNVMNKFSPPRASPRPPAQVKKDKNQSPLKLQVDGDKAEGDQLIARLLHKKKKKPAKVQDFNFQVNSNQYIRQYAHKSRPNRDIGSRIDFTETVFWECGLRTDDQGRASVSFSLSESVTSFRVFVDAITDNGVMGVTNRLISSTEPFYLEPKIPMEVTCGDEIHMPISLVNESPEQLSIDFNLQIDNNHSLKFSNTEDIKKEFAHKMHTEERKRVIAKLDVGDYVGYSKITINADAGPLVDRVTRKIRIAPEGFPFTFSASGKFEEENNVCEHIIEMPENFVRGSVETSVMLYLAPKGRLIQALKALLRMPCGCFEQTSATLYPVIMVQQYLQSHQDPDPDVVSQANNILKKGYRKLLGYECKDGGFEWFGRGPGHEALSAYGLAEFYDMAQVYPVDENLLERTKSWILSRRSHKGGFLRNLKSLDDFGRAPEHTTDAYIIFTLAESGLSELVQEELTTQLEKAKTEFKDDAYFVGLVSASLLKSERKNEAMPLVKKLTELQQDDGSVVRSKSSITNSKGKNLHIETTSICCLAWIDSGGEYAVNAKKAIDWILKQCSKGRFGSTQATILALRAIIRHDRSSEKNCGGTYRILIDGKIESELILNGTESDSITFPSFASKLTSGIHTIKIESPSGVSVPYSMNVDFNCLVPSSNSDCLIDIKTDLKSKEINEGEGTEIDIQVSNRSQEGLGMTLAIIGVPGGAEPRHEKLDELVESHLIDFYEIEGREIILYWRQMKPQEIKSLSIDIIGRVPGIYQAPASRAYLYYADDVKTWIAGSRMKIQS